MDLQVAMREAAAELEELAEDEILSEGGVLARMDDEAQERIEFLREIARTLRQGVAADCDHEFVGIPGGCIKCGWMPRGQ